MSARSVNGTVEFPGKGIKLRGMIKGFNPGGKQRKKLPNGDGSFDHTEVYVASTLKIDLSTVTATEYEIIQALIDEPMVVKYTNGKKWRVEDATYSEPSEIDENGTWPCVFEGSPAKRA